MTSRENDLLYLCTFEEIVDSNSIFFPFQPISREQFEDALKILRDEDFLIVTGRTSIRLM